MNIYNVIDSALDKTGIPYYHGMPEFSAGTEPQSYIVYTTREKPYFFASGENMAMQAWAAVSVFSPEVDRELYDRVIDKMSEVGFIYQDGTDVGDETGYPCKKHYAMDFIKTYGKE